MESKESNIDLPELDGIEDVPCPLPASIEVTEMPDLVHVPEKFQAMLVLRAMGWTYQSIGSIFDVSHVAVLKTCNRYDPDKRINLTKEVRREFLAKMFEAKASEALACLTPEKMKNAKPETLGKIAHSAAVAAEKMSHRGAPTPSAQSDLNRWLKKIEESRTPQSEEDDTS